MHHVIIIPSIINTQQFFRNLFGKLSTKNVNTCIISYFKRFNIKAKQLALLLRSAKDNRNDSKSMSGALINNICFNNYSLNSYSSILNSGHPFVS